MLFSGFQKLSLGVPYDHRQVSAGICSWFLQAPHHDLHGPWGIGLKSVALHCLCWCVYTKWMENESGNWSILRTTVCKGRHWSTVEHSLGVHGKRMIEEHWRVGFYYDTILCEVLRKWFFEIFAWFHWHRGSSTRTVCRAEWTLVASQSNGWSSWTGRAMPLSIFEEFLGGR